MTEEAIKATTARTQAMASAPATSSALSNVFKDARPSVSIPHHPKRTKLITTSSVNEELPPSPPKSTSPEIHVLHSSQGRATLSPAVESDYDYSHPVPLSQGALSSLNNNDAISPIMLAKYHLPELLLKDGPVSIKTIMNHLAQTVPGFAGVPPAKARRTVVAALEHRGGGGPDGDVIYEKVGWGKWDAHRQGEPSRKREHSLMVDGALSPPASYGSSYALSSAGLQIPTTFAKRRDAHSGGSWDSASLREEDEADNHDMAEHEADKMSLDLEQALMGEDDVVLDDDDDDDTDEEDWAAMGAAALRAGCHSASKRGTAGIRHKTNYNHLTERRASSVYRSGGPPSSWLTKSAPTHPHHLHSHPASRFTSPLVIQQDTKMHDTGVVNVVTSEQEREAAETLLRMGSM